MTDPIKEQIKRLIELAKEITGTKSSRKLALASKIHPSTLNRAEKADSQFTTSTSTLTLLHKFVREYINSGKATPDQIDLYKREYLPLEYPAISDSSKAASELAVALPEIDSKHIDGFQEDPRTIPVLGTAAGSALGAFEIGREAIDYVRRPPSLAGLKEIYAIYVVGDSMVPQHKPGELRIIHPNRPAVPGDSVVIQTYNAATNTREAFIKELVRDKGRFIVCKQHNPPMEITYLRPNGDPTNNEKNDSYVIRVHKVLTMNELHGV